MILNKTCEDVWDVLKAIKRNNVSHAAVVDSPIINALRDSIRSETQSET